MLCKDVLPLPQKPIPRKRVVFPRNSESRIQQISPDFSTDFSPGLNSKQQFSPARGLGTSSPQQAASGPVRSSKSSHSLLWLFAHSHDA
ncbi:uncharacterized protein LOC143034927 [Oratosquilla oratoria]|uniref:uncharacterized protein LOC143034927 n=1 Tax=Oratosquilla oratoria TaxID=337810 RepID=UPI003F761319